MVWKHKRWVVRILVWLGVSFASFGVRELIGGDTDVWPAIPIGLVMLGSGLLLAKLWDAKRAQKNSSNR